RSVPAPATPRFPQPPFRPGPACASLRSLYLQIDAQRLDPPMNPSEESSADPGRLIDEIVAYIRARQHSPEGEPKRPMDEERLLRVTVRQLRRHPLPTALMGISA